MAEYLSLKVPELKKLLAEKSLPLTGNKADLIARLQDHDKQTGGDTPAEDKEDEITYSDDEAPAAVPAAPAAAEPAPAPVADAPVAEDVPAATVTAEPAAPATEETPAEEKTAEPAKSYALGLSSSVADDEAKKRADRAKRFGVQEDDDAKKRADRAKRFGLDDKELASGLDAALPEHSRKRGRDRAEGDGNRPGKRQSQDRRGGGRQRGRGGRRGPPPTRDSGEKKTGILNDPAEKAKAEARAARFASG